MSEFTEQFLDCDLTPIENVKAIKQLENVKEFINNYLSKEKSIQIDLVKNYIDQKIKELKKY